jgi:hypothetical protein
MGWAVDFHFCLRVGERCSRPFSYISVIETMIFLQKDSIAMIKIVRRETRWWVNPALLRSYPALKMGWMFLRKHAGLAQECWFWLSTIGQFEVAGEWQRNACAPPEKSVINMIWKLPSISDWPIIMIRAGGSRTYLMSQFQFYWWYCKKLNN